MAGSSLFTATVPEQSRFSNLDLNAIGSTYANQFGHGTTALIARVVHNLIYNAAPKQFYPELRILGMKTPDKITTDEFFYHEKAYGRDPIVATAIVAPGASTQVVPVTPASTDVITVDTIVVYPNNQKATVTNVNKGANTITITAMTGQLLPAVAVNDVLANLSSVEADGANSIAQYFRATTIERYNFVQLFVKAIRFGKLELYKYMNAGTTDYIAVNRKEMLDQHRIDLSNAYWNGDRGEVTLSNGAKAKTMGGVFPLMQAAGSFNIATSAANLSAAVENLALNTEFGAWGDTRYLYGANRHLLALSKQYRSTLQRYYVGDKKAELYFEGIEMGSTKIVFVPMKRFEDSASFSPAWANRLILLDQESITPVIALEEEMGTTLDRRSGGTLNNFVDEWISATFSLKFNNPLASGWIDIL